MQQFSYKDTKLLRQTYKYALDQLYQNASQQRVNRLTDILTVILSTQQIPTFLNSLNTSGDIQITSSLEILRVKCGMYKQYSVEKLSQAVNAVLYQFSKQLKNYVVKVKQTKFQFNVIQFYGRAFGERTFFLVYVTFFKMIMSKYESQIRNQSKIEPQWSLLISNLINSLKKQKQQKSISKSIGVLYEICNQNQVFKRQVVKNGILPFLFDYIDQSKVKWLVIQNLKLIELLTQQKQVAKLLIQQNSQEVLIKIIEVIKSQELIKKVTGIMQNIVKFGDNQFLNSIIKQTKNQINAFNQNSQISPSLIKSLKKIKLYSKSTTFIKLLSQSSGHKWLAPILNNSRATQEIQLIVLEIFESILANKQQYKQINQTFLVLNKPLVENLKNGSNNVQKLSSYLRILNTGLKKDLVTKQYIKKNNISQLIQKYTKRQEIFIHKISSEILTIIQLKQGKVKIIPLQVNRKSKDIKQLQKVDAYLDNITNLNLFDQVKKQHIQILVEFLDLHQNEYPQQNQQQIKTYILKIKNKILQLMAHLFISKTVIIKLASQKILTALMNSLQISKSIKQTLQIIQVIINCCNFAYDKQKSLEIFQNLQKNTPLNQQITHSCGQILYYMNSISIGRQMMNNFKDQYKNIGYLQKLATCMSTVPDDIDQKDIQLVDNILNILSNQNFINSDDQLVQNWILILIRISKVSNLYKQKIRSQKKLLGLIEGKLEKANLNLFVLELFSNIIGYEEYLLNRIDEYYPSIDNIKPIEGQLKNLLVKVIDNNKYTNVQIKFIEKMLKYQQKIIIQKIKVKNNQLVYQAGQLFALVLQNNTIQSKKLPIVIEQLEKQIIYNGKNLIQALTFFLHLKYRQNVPDIRPLIQLIKIYSTLTLSKYQLYPINFTTLNLALKVLNRSLNKSDQSQNIDYSGLRTILLDIFKIFYTENKTQQPYNLDYIIGSDEKKEMIIQNIYSCLHSISKFQPFKFKQTDMFIKYAQNGNNAFIMYELGGIMQHSNFDQSKQIKSMLKFSLHKYPKVKNLISFQKKYEKKYKTQKTQNQVQVEQIYKQQSQILLQAQIKESKNIDQINQYNQVNNKGNQYIQVNKNQQQILEKQANQQYQKIVDQQSKNTYQQENTQIKSKQIIQQQSRKTQSKKIKISLQQILPIELVKNQLKQLETTGSSNIAIIKILDSIDQKNPEIASILIKLFVNSNNQQIKNKQQTRNKILRKIGQQNLVPTPQLFQMFQKYPQTLRLTQKIKIKGHQALDFGIKILEKYPAFGSRLIEYNITGQKQVQMLKQKQVPKAVCNVYSSKITDPDTARYTGLLIGSSCKHKTLQHAYFKLQVYKKMIECLKIHADKPKIISSTFFSLANATYSYQQATRTITTEQNLKIFLQVIKRYKKQANIVESGCCLISNLCYHNQHAKKVFFKSGVVQCMIDLFKISLDKQYKSQTFKQLLRVLGNCSLLVENARIMISLEFITHSISLIQLVNYNEDIQVLKYVVQIYSNLSSHTDADYKMMLTVIFNQGGFDILLTLLETQILNADIIAACIDSIDGMCQEKQIEKYAVSNGIIPLLIDILKSHEWNQKVVIKGIRVFSNLSLNKSFIIKLLQANFCSILANVIANRKLQKTKLSLYTMKIINRIFNCKVNTDIILQSSYIDSVLQSLKKQTQVVNQHLDIILYYSRQTNEFLNKKTFAVVVEILEHQLQNPNISNKCIQIIKNVQRNIEIQNSISNIINIFNCLIINRKLFSQTDLLNTTQMFSLLVNCCSKSQNLRVILREKNFIQGLVNWIKITSHQNQVLIESITVCIFIILNTYIGKPVMGIKQSESQDFLKKGIQCKMYRRDSSYKKAMINMNNEYQLRGFKYPDGQVKDKYRLHVLNIKDCMFDYRIGSRIWQLSVFSLSGGIFEKSAEPKNCCTIIGPITKNGAIIFNLEFATQAQKISFQRFLISLMKFLRDKKNQI